MALSGVLTPEGLATETGMEHLSLPVCQLSLPRLANSTFLIRHCASEACVHEKLEFASLPRFLSRGVAAASAAVLAGIGWRPWSQSRFGAVQKSSFRTF